MTTILSDTSKFINISNEIIAKENINDINRKLNANVDNLDIIKSMNEFMNNVKAPCTPSDIAKYFAENLSTIDVYDMEKQPIEGLGYDTMSLTKPFNKTPLFSNFPQHKVRSIVDIHKYKTYFLPFPPVITHGRMMKQSTPKLSSDRISVPKEIIETTVDSYMMSHADKDHYLLCPLNSFISGSVTRAIFERYEKILHYKLREAIQVVRDVMALDPSKEREYKVSYHNECMIKSCSMDQVLLPEIRDFCDELSDKWVSNQTIYFANSLHMLMGLTNAVNSITKDTTITDYVGFVRLTEDITALLIKRGNNKSRERTKVWVSYFTSNECMLINNVKKRFVFTYERLESFHQTFKCMIMYSHKFNQTTAMYNRSLMYSLAPNMDIGLAQSLDWQVQTDKNPEENLNIIKSKIPQCKTRAVCLAVALSMILSKQRNPLLCFSEKLFPPPLVGGIHLLRQTYDKFMKPINLTSDTHEQDVYSGTEVDKVIEFIEKASNKQLGYKDNIPKMPPIRLEDLFNTNSSNYSFLDVDHNTFTKDDYEYCRNKFITSDQNRNFLFTLYKDVIKKDINDITPPEWKMMMDRAVSEGHTNIRIRKLTAESWLSLLETSNEFSNTEKGIIESCLLAMGSRMPAVIDFTKGQHNGIREISQMNGDAKKSTGVCEHSNNHMSKFSWQDVINQELEKALRLGFMLHNGKHGIVGPYTEPVLKEASISYGTENENEHTYLLSPVQGYWTNAIAFSVDFSSWCQYINTTMLGSIDGALFNKLMPDCIAGEFIKVVCDWFTLKVIQVPKYVFAPLYTYESYPHLDELDIPRNVKKDYVKFKELYPDLSRIFYENNLHLCADTDMNSLVSVPTSCMFAQGILGSCSSAMGCVLMNYTMDQMKNHTYYGCKIIDYDFIQTSDDNATVVHFDKPVPDALRLHFKEYVGTYFNNFNMKLSPFKTNSSVTKFMAFNSAFYDMNTSEKIPSPLRKMKSWCCDPGVLNPVSNAMINTDSYNENYENIPTDFTDEDFWQMRWIASNIARGATQFSYYYTHSFNKVCPFKPISVYGCPRYKGLGLDKMKCSLVDLSLSKIATEIGLHTCAATLIANYDSSSNDVMRPCELSILSAERMRQVAAVERSMTSAGTNPMNKVESANAIRNLTMKAKNSYISALYLSVLYAPNISRIFHKTAICDVTSYANVKINPIEDTLTSDFVSTYLSTMHPNLLTNTRTKLFSQFNYKHTDIKDVVKEIDDALNGHKRESASCTTIIQSPDKDGVSSIDVADAYATAVVLSSDNLSEAMEILDNSDMLDDIRLAQYINDDELTRIIPIYMPFYSNVPNSIKIDTDLSKYIPYKGESLKSYITSSLTICPWIIAQSHNIGLGVMVQDIVEHPIFPNGRYVFVLRDKLLVYIGRIHKPLTPIRLKIDTSKHGVHMIDRVSNSIIQPYNCPITNLSFPGFRVDTVEDSNDRHSEIMNLLESCWFQRNTQDRLLWRFIPSVKSANIINLDTYEGVFMDEFNLKPSESFVKYIKTELPERTNNLYLGIHRTSNTRSDYRVMNSIPDRQNLTRMLNTTQKEYVKLQKTDFICSTSSSIMDSVILDKCNQSVPDFYENVQCINYVTSMYKKFCSSRENDVRRFSKLLLTILRTKPLDRICPRIKKHKDTRIYNNYCNYIMPKLKSHSARVSMCLSMIFNSSDSEMSELDDNYMSFEAYALSAKDRKVDYSNISLLNA